jgi:hypothetical protein
MGGLTDQVAGSSVIGRLAVAPRWLILLLGRLASQMAGFSKVELLNRSWLLRWLDFQKLNRSWFLRIAAVKVEMSNSEIPVVENGKRGKRSKINNNNNIDERDDNHRPARGEVSITQRGQTSSVPLTSFRLLKIVWKTLKLPNSLRTDPVSVSKR